MITILLAGQARVGKTTAANYIADLAKKKYDCKPIILPFAKAIKDAAANAGLTKENSPEEYRKFCQSIGESKRLENPDYWINIFEEEWRTLAVKDEELMNNPDKLWKERVVIVDDCRYMNELNLGRRLGAKTVFISRDNRTLEDQSAEWRKHESEHLANEVEAGNKDYKQCFNYIIKNGKSLEEFIHKLEERTELFLEAAAESHLDCDCVVCTKFRVDEEVTLNEFLDGLFPKEEDGENK